MKRKKSKHTLQIERCDKLYREIIILKAENKSELSGNNVDQLHVHHSAGKKTNALRYDLRGGIALTYREHLQGVHSSDPSVSWEYQNRIRDYMKQREGEQIFDILVMQKNNTGMKLDMIAITLKEELNRLKNEKQNN